MKAISIRNIPDDVYRTIVKLARRNRRSIQQQVIVILERSSRMHGDPPMHRASELRERLKGRELGNTVKEIRDERSR